MDRFARAGGLLAKARADKAQIIAKGVPDAQNQAPGGLLPANRVFYREISAQPVGVQDIER